MAWLPPPGRPAMVEGALLHRSMPMLQVRAAEVLRQADVVIYGEEMCPCTSYWNCLCILGCRLAAERSMLRYFWCLYSAGVWAALVVGTRFVSTLAFLW